MLSRRARKGALSCFVALVATSLQAQQSELPAGATFEFSTEVSSIIVPVTVKDSRGRLISTLPQEKFHLRVDGIEFPIASFWREGGLPLSLTFVVDTSGSMGGRRLRRAREVVEEFLRQRRPSDEFALITFGAGEVKRRVRFGTDPDLIPRVLESVKGFGTTALYDVVAAAPQLMEGAHNVRRAIILFTDGVDTASELGAEEAVRILEGLVDPLYVLGIEPPPADEEEGPADTYEKILKGFADASGGRYALVEDVSRLLDIGRDLRRELTMRYIINIEPSGIGTSKWRKIEILVDGDYSVQARQGYRGTLP